MNHFWNFLVLLFVLCINAALILTLGIVALVSQARIEWMIGHAMNAHYVGYTILGVALILVGAFALKQGWKLTKVSYYNMLGRYTEENHRDFY